MSTPPANDAPSPTTRRVFWLFIVAFVLWGLIVAVGATGYFTDVGLFDPRRSLIVIGCTILFGAFWCWVFLRPRTARQEIGDLPRTSGASLSSLVSVGIGFVGWGVSAIAEGRVALAASLISLGGMGLAALLAIIGLSDSRPRRLKLLGLVSLALLAGALVVVVAGVWIVD